MSFLEKNIEYLLYNHLEECRDRGLLIEPITIAEKYRQLALGSAGIADIVFMGHEYRASDLAIQIVECKRDTINMATYAQACRYAAKIECVLGPLTEDFENIKISKILVGQRVDTRGDFLQVVASDYSAYVITYEYGINGVQFKTYDTYLELARWHHERRAAKVNPQFTRDLTSLLENLTLA